MTRLTLDRSNKKFLGVCSGISAWSEIDVSIIRILFAATALIGVGSPILIYFLMALILD
jgi:phage shock protein C